MKTSNEYLNEAYEIIKQNQSDKHEDIDPVLLKMMDDYANDKLHKIGTEILKKSFEVYTPLRKQVVQVPDIVFLFNLGGVDIVEKINF